MVGKKKGEKYGGKEQKSSNSDEDEFFEDLNSMNSMDADELKSPKDKKRTKTKRKCKTVTSPHKIAKKRGRKSNERIAEEVEEDLDETRLNLEHEKEEELWLRSMKTIT